MSWYWIVLIIIVWCIVSFFLCKYYFKHEVFDDWLDYLILAIVFIVSPLFACPILIASPLIFLGWLLKKLINKNYD